MAQADTIVRLGMGEKLVIVDATGRNKITIDPQDNTILIEGLGDIRLNAGGKVTIEGEQGVELRTPAQVSVEGSSGVDVHTDAIMNLQSQAEMNLQTSGQMAIDGAMVLINS